MLLLHAQELTPTGVFVRAIGEGIIHEIVFGVAASADMIAVSSSCKVYVFHASGNLLQSFGEEGEAEGQLCRCDGLRFTPEGSHILVSEAGNNRLSLFTLAGDFVRCILTRPDPCDVEFTSSGDILVANRDEDCISEFSPDGSVLFRIFGEAGLGPGQFQFPTALAMLSEQLFVLDYSSARVHVFS